MKACTCVSPVRVSSRRARGPAELGAAPASRASVRNVLLVATTRSGAPVRSSRSAGVSSRFATCSREPGHARPCVGGSAGEPLAGQPRGAERHRERLCGSSSAPAASSSEPPPMSRQIRLPALQPNHRRTARKVSRASSSPDSTLSATPASFAHPLEHLRAVAGVAHRRRREGQQLVAAELVRLFAAPRSRRATARRAPRSGELAGLVDVLGKAQLATCRDCCGAAAAPRCASTTSRWTVFEPTSSTPNRTPSNTSRSHTLDGCRNLRFRSTSRGVDRVRRSRRRLALDPRRPDLAVLALDLHLRPRMPRHGAGPREHRVLQPRRVLLRQGRQEAGRAGSPRN